MSNFYSCWSLDYYWIKILLLCIIFLLIVITVNLAKVRIPFSTCHDITRNSIDLIHSDIWGIVHMFSHTHCKYFVTFIDNFSCLTWIYFLRSKPKVFNAFQKLFAWIENQFSYVFQTFFSNIWNYFPRFMSIYSPSLRCH